MHIFSKSALSPLFRYSSLLHTRRPLDCHLSSHLQHLYPHLICPCLFHLVHCCFHFFLSYLLHFHLFPDRARELKATCCSFSFQQLLEVCRPYPQHFLSVMSIPLLSVITAHLFTSLLPSVLSRSILNIIFCDHLRQAFGTVIPVYSSVLCPPPSWLSSSSGYTVPSAGGWLIDPLCL